MRVSKLRTTTLFSFRFSFRCWFSCEFSMSTAYLDDWSHGWNVTIGLNRHRFYKRSWWLRLWLIHPRTRTVKPIVKRCEISFDIKIAQISAVVKFYSFQFSPQKLIFPSFQQSLSVRRSAHLFSWPRNNFEFLSSAVLMISVFLCIFLTSHTRRKNCLRSPPPETKRA